MGLTVEALEVYVRIKVQAYIQDILEEEVNCFFSRRKSKRIKKGIDIPKGCLNGYGKLCKLALINRTVKLTPLFSLLLSFVMRLCYTIQLQTSALIYRLLK